MTAIPPHRGLFGCVGKTVVMIGGGGTFVMTGGGGIDPAKGVGGVFIVVVGRV